MKKFLKRITIDNIIALIISAIVYVMSGYFMCEAANEIFKMLWFVAFFISFGIVLYNLYQIMQIKHLGRKIKDDIEYINEKLEKKDK